MDFTFDEELEMVRGLAKDFTDQEVRPRAEEIEREHHVPRELLGKMAELGLMGVAVPEEYGGAGLGETGLCVVMEELTRGDFATAVTFGGGPPAAIGTNTATQITATVPAGSTSGSEPRALSRMWRKGETAACSSLMRPRRSCAPIMVWSWVSWYSCCPRARPKMFTSNW